jgi:hypothetical protein
MLKKLIIISLSYFPCSAFGAEFEFSLGSGFQYSGLIGTQFALKHEESKYFVSVGLPGYSLGMQTIVSDSEYHSAGFSVGKTLGILSSDGQYGFITYNYHMDGFKSNGWVFGAGVGLYREESYTALFNNERRNSSTDVMYTLDIGYKF